MVPAPHLQPTHFSNHVGCVRPDGGSNDATSYIWKHMIRSDPNSSFSDTVPSKKMDEERVDDEGDMGWLQLGLGSHVTRLNGFDSIAAPDQRGGITELDLFSDQAAPMAQVFQVTGIRSPPRPSAHLDTTRISNPSLFSEHVGTSMSFRQQLEAMLGSYWHGPWNPMTCSSSSSSPMPFYAQPLRHTYSTTADPLSIDEMRVVDPPLRLPPGLWLLLQASQDQEKETFLPQVPKSYLRIRDGKMTVRLLMKYLSHKLGLNNESEVQITCKEQQLLPLMTLQHVRDNIWCSSSMDDDAATSLTHCSTAGHVMILQYSKITRG